jgi:hypothetical protein
MMSWLPRFTNWQVAALAAAVAIPALLVLYFLKLRRREMAVSSTILWKKAIQDLQVNAPFQRLRRNLLLFLQLLLLALLILALAKPVVNVTPTPGETTVILIDRSASMSAKNADGKTIRLDEAKRRARELVDSMPRDATAMVIAFDDRPEMMQPWTSDANLLRDAIDKVKPTDRRTRLKLAYQLAEAKLFFIPEANRSNVEPPDVRVFSDGRVLDAAELAIKSPVTLERVGDESGAPNIAVVALSAKRNYERPTEVQVFARLANFGIEPVSSSVELTVDGQPVQTGSSNGVYLLPERWNEQQRQEYARKPGNRQESPSVEFQLDLTESAVVRVEQTRREGDALAADDVAQVVVPPPKQLSVLLVSDGNYFLELVLRSQRQLEKMDVMSPVAFEENKPADYDVYVFDRYKPKALPQAGHFMYFGTVPDGLRVKAVRDANGAPVMLEYPEDAATVLDWDRDHPILRGPTFNRMWVSQSVKLEVPLDSEVLIDGMKGPLVVLHRENNAIHLITAFDILDSTLPIPPDSQSFVLFIYNTLEYLAVGSDMEVRQTLDPGSTPRIPRSALMKGSEPIKQVTLIDPAGGFTTLTVPAAGDFALPGLERVGIYQTDPPIPQFERMAVNLLDPNESNLIPATSAPGGKPEDVKQGSGKVRRDLWRYFVMGGIAMLFVEWWVYTRRVHL